MKTVTGKICSFSKSAAVSILGLINEKTGQKGELTTAKNGLDHTIKVIVPDDKIEAVKYILNRWGWEITSP